MYCYYNVLLEAILLVNNIVYIKKNWGDLPAMNICLHAKFQVLWSTVLAVQLSKIKWKKSKNMFRCISQMLCRNTFIFVEFILFFMFLTLMSLEIEIT